MPGDRRRGELVVVVEIGDREPAAHREVDDRGGDVDEVRVLVDERPDLAGQDAVGRHELDRARVARAEPRRVSSAPVVLPNAASMAEPA